jgi:SagB-type dehydrogenase family enzyme
MNSSADRHDISISAVKATTHALPPRSMFTTLLVSPSPHMVAQAPALVEYLAETGLEVIVMTQQAALDKAISEHVLVVAPSFESEAAEYHQRCDAISRSRRWSWLRAVMNDCGGEFQVGPLFTAESVPCYTCAARRFPKLTSDWNNELVAAREAALNVFAAWLAETVSRICGGVFLLNGEFVICKLPSLLTHNRVAIRDRQCAACGGSKTTDSTSTAYQQAVEMLQDYFNMAGSRMRNRYFGENHCLDTGQIRKNWNYDENLVLLPYVEASKPTRVFEMLSSIRRRSAASLTLKDIASMLRYSAGYRAIGTANGLGRRWCASAGNKGSVTLQIDVQGIPAIADGLYLYRDADHALEPLSTRDLPRFCVDLHLGGQARLRSKRKYDIIVIGDYQRLYGKYGIFASKLVYLDIGVATAQLLRYAFGLKMKPQFYLTANSSHVESGIVPFIQRPSVLVRIEPSVHFQEKRSSCQ